MDRTSSSSSIFMPQQSPNILLTRRNAIRYLPQASTKYVMRKYMYCVYEKWTMSRRSQCAATRKFLCFSKNFSEWSVWKATWIFHFCSACTIQLCFHGFKKKKKTIFDYGYADCWCRKIDALDLPLICAVCMWSQCLPHLIHCVVNCALKNEIKWLCERKVYRSTFAAQRMTH